VKYLFYPGCSLKGTARDYEESLLAVAPLLGLELEELQGWRCCGSSAARSKDLNWAYSLSARTIATARERGMDLLMACPACYANHLRALKAEQSGDESTDLDSAGPGPRVKHLLEVLAFDVGPDEIRRRTVRPLPGIRAVPYYGCLVTRPFPLGGVESRENPKAMEAIVEATGAVALSFPPKGDCCGGALLFSHEAVALKLTASILEQAKDLSADCLVVVCPLCHFMLDAKQRAAEREVRRRFGLPVLYLTQWLGLAMDVDLRKLGIHRLVTSPAPLLHKRGAREPLLSVESLLGTLRLRLRGATSRIGRQ